MNNLIIALISVAFAAALSLAGVNYVSRTTSVSQTEAVSNTDQVQKLVTDYQNLHNNLGRQPLASDFAAQYATSGASTTLQSQNLAYGYSGGTLTTNSSMDGAPGQWTYVPTCGGMTNQDCFVMKVTSNSSAIYNAARLSALQELSAANSSRIELNISAASVAAAASTPTSAVTNPQSWPASVPANGYYLTLRLNAQNPPNVSSATGYSYTANPVYQLSTPACGEANETLVSWTCTQNPGGTTVDNSKCVTPPGTRITTDMSGCSSTWSVCSTYAACSANQELCTAWDCFNSVKGDLHSSNCSAPAPLPCTGSGNSGGNGTSTAAQGSATTTNGNQASPLSGASGGSNATTFLTANLQCNGACAPACGASTSTASWICEDNHGNTYQQKTCIQNGVTAPTCPCTDYSLCTGIDPAYGPCSNQCGTGTAKLQTWICGTSNGSATSAQSYCVANNTVPASSEACTSYDGCTYKYDASSAMFGTCTPSCGPSIEPLLTPGKCTRSDGTVIPPTTPFLYPYWAYTLPDGTTSNACAADVIRSQPCNSDQTCVPNYGACNTKCGTGTAQLTTCTDGSGKIVTSNSNSCPATEACTDYTGCTTFQPQPPPYTENIVWGSCSTTCGYGIQGATGGFPCYAMLNGVNEGMAPDSYCIAAGTEPTQNCVEATGDYGAACVTVGGTYGDCSTTCGTGTKSLNPGSYSCRDVSGNTAPANFCTPPAQTKACTNLAGCQFSTVVQPNPVCLPACGTSTYNLNWSCVGQALSGSDNGPFTVYTCTNGTCTTPSGGPVTTAYCAPPPPETCSSTATCQAVPAYGSCNTTCGTGSEALTSWVCENPAGAQVNSSWCITPASSLSCTQTTGCQYSATPTYGQCAAYCGASTAPLSLWTCSRSYQGTTTVLDTYTCDSTGNNCVDSHGTAPNGPCTAPASTAACTSNAECGNISYQAIVDSQSSCIPTTNCGQQSTEVVGSWHCEKYIASTDAGQVSQSLCTNNAVQPVGSYCTYTGNCYTYTANASGTGNSTATYSACYSQNSTGPSVAGTQTLQAYQCWRSDAGNTWVQISNIGSTPGCAPENLTPAISVSQSCTGATTTTYTASPYQ